MLRRAQSHLLLLLLLLLGPILPALGAPAGASPPVMGWSTWCTQQTCSDYSRMPLDWCSSGEVLDVARAMREEGLLAAGYDHILLDDCWGVRDPATQRITWDADRFPEGMPWLVRQVHALGFRFGLYTAVGRHACHWNDPSWPTAVNFTGSWPHYARDARAFVDWEVDYVKLDDCGPWHDTPRALVSNFSQALRDYASRQKHHVWLNLGGPFQIGSETSGISSPDDDDDDDHDNAIADEPDKNMSCRMASGSWCAESADSFRVWDDHHDDWESTKEVIEHGLGESRRAWYGSGADADFLFTGGQGCGNHSAPGERCPGQTDREYTTSFSIWSLFSGQLVFATDPRNMSALQRKLWLNQDILDVVRNRPESLADVVVFKNKSTAVFVRPLVAEGEAVVALFNGNDGIVRSVGLRWRDVPKLGWGDDTSLETLDLWTKDVSSSVLGGIAIAVAPHSTVVLRLRPAKQITTRSKTDPLLP